MTATRTIQRAKAYHARPSRTATLSNHAAKARMHEHYYAEGVTRCSRCPPASFCDACMAVNKGRIQCGLIRPRDADVDHKNNCLYATPLGKGRVPDKLINRGGPVVTAHLRQLGGGWRQGLASLDGEVIYEGAKTRSMDEAWAFARSSADQIREGLRFEALLDA